MIFQDVHFHMLGTDLVFSSVGVGFGRDIHRRILTAAQLLIARTSSSSHSCIFQLHIFVRFEECVSQSGHRGGLAFGYSRSKEILGNRGDCDCSRPWHEGKGKLALLVVELVHLAIGFPS